MSQLGAQLYTVREFTQTIEDLRDTLAKVKAIGYNVVQLSGLGKDLDPQAVRDALDENGLIAPATHITFDEMKNDFEGVVRKHRIWGSAYPGVGGLPGEYRTDAQGYRRFAKEASEVAKKFKDEGMTFIYHNHHFEFMKYDGITAYEILLNESDPALQFEMDVYWVQAGGGDILDWIERVRGRMDVVHLKDMQIVEEDGIKQAFAEIGQGNLNFKKILPKLKDIGVKWYFVEQDRCFRSPFESLKMSFDYLDGLGLK